MPTVQVRYYSRLRDLTGTHNENVVLDQDGTVQDILNAVYSRHEALLPFHSNLLLARNAEYCTVNDHVHEGDVVDLMPPVSGG